MSLKRTLASKNKIDIKYVHLIYYVTILLVLLFWAWFRGLLDPAKQPMWCPIPFHTLQFILDAFSATFIASIIFRRLAEGVVRKELAGYIADAVLLNYTYLAQLSPKIKRMAIQFLLEDMLGLEFAPLIFKAHIEPYAKEKQISFRESRRYDARIEKLAQKFTIHLGNGKQHELKQNLYHRLDTHDMFVIPFQSSWKREKSVEIILSFDHSQLVQAFDEPLCVFREAVMLAEQDCQILKEKIRKNGIAPDAIGPFIQGVNANTPMLVDCLLDRNQLLVKSVEYDERVGIRIRYDLPDRLLLDTAQAEFDIRIRIPFSRLQSRYPIIYGEPTRVWLVTLDVNSIHASSLVWDPMFTVSAPDRMLISEPSEGRIELNFGGEWVFPTSGIVFSWRDSDFEEAVAKLLHAVPMK